MTLSPFLNLVQAVSAERWRGSFYQRHAGLVAIVALGGFPIEGEPGAPSWCGSPCTVESLQLQVLKGWGLSGVLTYMNPKDKSLESLGRMCQSKGHNWALKWLNLSLVFCSPSPEVEMAFARDTRFFLSWVSGPSMCGGMPFVATGSLSSWMKFASTENVESGDFPAPVCEAMTKAKALVGLFVLPESEIT